MQGKKNEGKGEGVRINTYIAFLIERLRDGESSEELPKANVAIKTLG